MSRLSSLLRRRYARKRAYAYGRRKFFRRPFRGKKRVYLGRPTKGTIVYVPQKINNSTRTTGTSWRTKRGVASPWWRNAWYRTFMNPWGPPDDRFPFFSRFQDDVGPFGLYTGVFHNSPQGTSMSKGYGSTRRRGYTRTARRNGNKKYISTSIANTIRR